MAREHRMIEPFVDGQVRQGAISYGVSSYGYDMRVAPEFRIFTNVLSAIVDPQTLRRPQLRQVRRRRLHRPAQQLCPGPVGRVLPDSPQRLTICVGKSTYARCGIITNVTPFEPEWEGYVTLEISNTTPLPAKIYANEGICQVLFFEADDDDVCETSYADKKGKYQKQTGVTLPKL